MCRVCIQLLSVVLSGHSKPSSRVYFRISWMMWFFSLPPMDSLGLPSDVCITYVIWMFGIGGRKYLWYKQFTGHGGSCAVYLEKWLASAMSRVDKVRLIFLHYMAFFIINLQLFRWLKKIRFSKYSFLTWPLLIEWGPTDAMRPENVNSLNLNSLLNLCLGYL